MRPLKETNGTPTPRSNVRGGGNEGSPTGREPYGDGAAIVLCGRESRPLGEGRQVFGMYQEGEVREMRNAVTTLGIIRERGRRRLPVEDVYRQLFNPELYLLAYGKIAKNAGALTLGATDETADGMALATIQRIIELLRQERYHWTPVRRIHIPKANGKTRPLGLPTWSDKLLQEVIRLILEAYYEPQFSGRSHGFRPGRGCHTALREIYHTWRGTVWFIEGDITECFDHLDHEVLLNILRDDIHDNRFVRLIGNLLRAGYLEDWTYRRTLSGTPQGGIVSPILANIYLDRLDKWVERVLIPEYTRGDQRRRNPAYERLRRGRSQAKTDGDAGRARTLLRQMRNLPTCDPQDPSYRRLRYIRYADDFLLGFSGPCVEAEEIKRRLGEYLRDTLTLELSESKTLLTHGRTGAARFLGYDLVVLQADDRLTKMPDGRAVRTLSGRIGLKVPSDVVREKCAPYLARGKPIHRAERSNDAVFSIIARYEAEYRGIVNYYRMAYNLHRLGRLKWVMEVSLTKTLAHKLKISVSKVYRRYHTQVKTDSGARKVLRVTVPRAGRPPLVAMWGAITLVRQVDVTWLDDDPPAVWNTRTEIVERLLAGACELCGSREQVEVHHIKALKDLNRGGHADQPAWKKLMAARRRKTLVVCKRCHGEIHAGHLPRRANTITEH